MSWGQGWWGFGSWGVCSPSGPDAEAPSITWRDPLPGTLNVANDASIAFRVTDGGAPDAAHTGVDFSSIRITVTQVGLTVIAFEQGAFKTNFNGPSGFVGPNQFGGFDFVLDPALPWTIGASITVSVECVDGNCNVLFDAWTFSVGACIAEPCGAVTSLSYPSTGGWGTGPWGTLPWGGGGEPTTITQIIGGGSPIVATFSPPTGTTLGGTDFTITGTDLACFAFNDIFSDAVVDPMLWWVVGAGSTTEAPLGLGGKLVCAIPAVAHHIAGVSGQALTLKTDFHIEVDYEVKTQFLQLKPAFDVTLAALRAEFDAGDYLQISFILKSGTTVGTMRCEVWKLGSLVHTSEIDTTAATGRIGVMRYYDPIFNDYKAAFWWNGTKILDTFDCPSCTMRSRFYTENNASAYAIETHFDNFVSHTVVAFLGVAGTDVATNVIEVSDLKVRGKTPATIGAWAGPISVRVTNGNGNGCPAELLNCFTYQFPDGFVIGRSEPYRPTRRELSLVGDPILRNPGKNIGHGLRRQS